MGWPTSNTQSLSLVCLSRSLSFWQAYKYPSLVRLAHDKSSVILCSFCKRKIIYNCQGGVTGASQLRYQIKEKEKKKNKRKQSLEALWKPTFPLPLTQAKLPFPRSAAFLGTVTLMQHWSGGPERLQAYYWRIPILITPPAILQVCSRKNS